MAGRIRESGRERRHFRDRGKVLPGERYLFSRRRDPRLWRTTLEPKPQLWPGVGGRTRHYHRPHAFFRQAGYLHQPLALGGRLGLSHAPAQPWLLVHPSQQQLASELA